MGDARPLTIRGQAGYTIAMYILCFESGGTKLVASVADLQGRLVDTVIERRSRNQKAPETLDRIYEMGRRILDGRPLSAIGFGFGGTVRRSDRRPTSCFHEEGWDGVDARAFLSGRFEVPVLIENDCKLAALAEAWEGPSAPAGILLYVTIGTGIGAGIVRRGYLVELGDLGEAEIGHVIVEPGGLPCACGNRGCLEAYCSGPGLKALARQSTGQDREPEELMEAFRRAEPGARRTVEQAAEYLGRALGMAVNLFAPDQIVLGGGVMTDNGAFLDLVRNRAEAFAFRPFWSALREFRSSRLGPQVVGRGAAIYVLQQRGKQAPGAQFRL